MTDQSHEISHPWHVGRLIVAWVCSAVFSMLILVFSPAADQPEWLILSLAASVLVAFGLQLGTAQRAGFITRTAVSVTGSLVLFAIALILSVTLMPQ